MAVSLLASPVRRVGTDYATASGEELVRQAIFQVLMTEPGELPWRPRFGAGMEGVLHHANDAVTAAIAKTKAEGALDAWLPGNVKIVGVEPERDGSTLRLRVRYRVGSQSGEASVELQTQGDVF